MYSPGDPLTYWTPEDYQKRTGPKLTAWWPQDLESGALIEFKEDSPGDALTMLGVPAGYYRIKGKRCEGHYYVEPVSKLSFFLKSLAKRLLN